MDLVGLMAVMGAFGIPLYVIKTRHEARKLELEAMTGKKGELPAAKETKLLLEENRDDEAKAAARVLRPATLVAAADDKRPHVAAAAALWVGVVAAATALLAWVGFGSGSRGEERGHEVEIG